MNKRKPGRIFVNLGLKIAALAIASVLWLAITNYTDPLISRTFYNVTVNLRHTNILTDRGEVYTVLDDTNVVPVVTVYARRSIAETLEESDIIAYADIEGLSSLNTAEIKYYSVRNNSDIEMITGSIDNVRLSIEKKLARTLTLRTAVTGEVAEGYQVGSITPDQNQVRVSGPESVVSNISYAMAVVDVSNATSTISTYADIRLYDSSDVQISDISRVTMNINTVKVSVSVLPISDILISATPSGIPAEGYLLTGEVTIDPEAVELAGRSAQLARLQNIVIPSSELDVTGQTQTMVKTVNLTEWLPDGLTFADESFDGNVVVTVVIEQAQMIAIETDVAGIDLVNIPEGYSAEVTAVSDDDGVMVDSTMDTTFEINLMGLRRNVDGITMAELVPVLDVGKLVSGRGKSDLTGAYTGTLQFSLPEGVTQTNTVTVKIQLESLSTGMEEEPDEESMALEEILSAQDQEQNTDTEPGE